VCYFGLGNGIETVDGLDACDGTLIFEQVAGGGSNVPPMAVTDLEHRIPQFDANIRPKPYSLERLHFEEYSMTFDELRSNFQTVRRQFKEATTIQEKQRLLAISKQIIKAAHGEIDDFRRGFASRMIFVGTLMTASPRVPQSPLTLNFAEKT